MINFFKQLLQKQETATSTLTITSSNGFHLRPIAKFVNEVKKYSATITLLTATKEISALQVPNILSLSLEKGDSFELKCVGEEAQKASEELSQFFNRLMQEDTIEEKIRDEEETYESPTIKGVILSKGVAIGTPIAYFKERTVNPNGVTFKEALQETAKELEKLYQANKDKKEAEIFLAHQSLLSSEMFQNEFEQIDQAIERLRGGKFESRMADYRDIQKRIESHMGIEESFTLPNEPHHDYILIVPKEQEILPSEVEALSRLAIGGVILQSGSITSHTAILLRSFQIPTIITNEEIPQTEQNSISILDASSAQFIATPSKNDLTKAHEKREQFKEAESQAYQNRFNKLTTKNNEPIKILANITNVQSAKEAKEQGADGIGLFRTEFLFTEHKPTIEEQTNAYQEVFELFDEVTIRTLDIGGDKSLPYINIEKEENPFLGIRGIRFSLQEQTLLKEQLLAIFQAVNAISSDNKTIKIMFPMVSTTQEFVEAKKVAQEVAKEHNLDITNIQFGIMLEVPSVIFALKAFDKLVDFYSIGSNDLTQYLFAIERTHPTLSVDPTSPIIFEALKYIKANTLKPISICGELAGLEKSSHLLVKIGYLNLSVSSKIIPTLKNNINTILHD